MYCWGFVFVLLPLVFNMKPPVLGGVVFLIVQILLVWCSVGGDVISMCIIFICLLCAKESAICEVH